MSKNDTETRLFIPCGCVSQCTVLAVDRWRWDDDINPWNFEIYTRAHAKSPLRWRIKTAVNVLLNRDHYFDALTFDDREIQKLRDFLDSKLAQAELEVRVVFPVIHTDTVWNTNG